MSIEAHTGLRQRAEGKRERKILTGRDVLVHSCESILRGQKHAYMCVGSRAAARSNGDSPSLVPSHRNSPSSSPSTPLSCQRSSRSNRRLSSSISCKCYQCVTTYIVSPLLLTNGLFVTRPSLAALASLYTVSPCFFLLFLYVYIYIYFSFLSLPTLHLFFPPRFVADTGGQRWLREIPYGVNQVFYA